MRLATFAAASAAVLLAAAPAGAQTSSQTSPQAVQVFAAGSLRGVVGGLEQAGPALGLEVKGEFGGSGSMRERIEKGEKPDLLMSADMGSPQKLQAEGRTVLPVVAFAKNRECVVAKTALGVTPANLTTKLLDPKVRIKTSQPVADPSGDYTWAIFDKIEAQKPGGGQTLKAKATPNMTLTAPPTKPGQSALAALFANDKIDMTIVYCSAAIDKEVPGLSSFPIPTALDPHPVYGVAVLNNRPETLRLALYLLSESGQAIVAKNGLVPLVDGAR
ncbi:MAG TPA: extracellular solute-binding protein [Caulobacteraceae bacterium]|jgi:ABC-type molybdate transport system substrate-binding protein